MESGRVRCCPALHHNVNWLLGELRVLLEEAVESQEHACLRVIAEPSRTHHRNVIAHEIAEQAAERWYPP
jgi:hypothetical protein